MSGVQDRDRRTRRSEPGWFEGEWRRRFERFARSYEADHCVSGWSEQGLARRLDVFMAAYERMGPPQSARVLDLGCGPGTYGRWLGARGNVVVGMDYSLPSLQKAERNDCAQRRSGGYVQGDAYQLPFVDSAFDVVLCVGVLQALVEAPRALREMTRVLRPSGLLFLDGLNAVGLPALIALVRRLTHGPRLELLRYRPVDLRRHLSGLGYHDLTVCPVVVLPPPFDGVARRFRYARPWLLVLAHSFFLVGRKQQSPSAPASPPLGRARPLRNA